MTLNVAAKEPVDSFSDGKQLLKLVERDQSPQAVLLKERQRQIEEPREHLGGLCPWEGLRLDPQGPGANAEFRSQGVDGRESRPTQRGTQPLIGFFHPSYHVREGQGAVEIDLHVVETGELSIATDPAQQTGLAVSARSGEAASVPSLRQLKEMLRLLVAVDQLLRV